VITSIQNNLVKEWRKLHTRKHRVRKQQFLIEGFHLIEEAHYSGWELETVIIQNGITYPTWVNDYHTNLVNERVFKEISQTETPQGIAAVVHMKALTKQHDSFILLIDAIQDPGNLGTIIRTADAAGFSQIILGTGTVDLYNDKVIRASQGSIFHIPIKQAVLSQKIAELKEENYTVWASGLTNGVDINSLKIHGKTALILGNEGAGISEEILKAVNGIVKIPMYGKAESLNVSVAAGILMYNMRK